MLSLQRRFEGDCSGRCIAQIETTTIPSGSRTIRLSGGDNAVERLCILEFWNLPAPSPIWGGMKHPPDAVVLLVEDEPMIRMVTTESFEDDGLEVISAEDAAEAIQVLQSRADVAVLFTDVTLPGEPDGVGLAEEVSRRWPNIHIVLTSGKDRVEESRLPDRCRFVPKPYEPGVLARVIKAMARGD
jgi:CheY-like chemotaxis protein